jgi:hypothetical protein
MNARGNENEYDHANGGCAPAAALIRIRRKDKMIEESLYKNYLIHGESFQREKNGAWVPQYTVTRQDGASEKKDYPSHQYQFNHACSTEREADEFAVQKARDWIDRAAR